jgi:hypothetical protein
MGMVTKPFLALFPPNKFERVFQNIVLHVKPFKNQNPIFFPKNQFQKFSKLGQPLLHIKMPSLLYLLMPLLYLFLHQTQIKS